MLACRFVWKYSSSIICDGMHESIKISMQFVTYVNNYAKAQQHNLDFLCYVKVERIVDLTSIFDLQHKLSIC